MLLRTKGLQTPDDLVSRMTAAGFDLDKPVSEYENRERQELLFAQDETPDNGFVLKGRRTFCGMTPRGSKK